MFTLDVPARGLYGKGEIDKGAPSIARLVLLDHAITSPCSKIKFVAAVSFTGDVPVSIRGISSVFNDKKVYQLTFANGYVTPGRYVEICLYKRSAVLREDSICDIFNIGETGDERYPFIIFIRQILPVGAARRGNLISTPAIQYETADLMS